MRVVALGTGQALDLARRGDADVVFVHAKSAEEEFLSEGHGVRRFPVMYNDFVIVGPKVDPARIAGGDDTLDAFRKIKNAGAPFVSRGDRSGTHIAELSFWTMAGVDIAKEKGPWYRETGQGMGPALNTASSMNAYLLADRATWLAFNNRGELAILVEGDKRLMNQYGVILVNPDKHPSVKRADGQAFIDWLISPRGRPRSPTTRSRASSCSFRTRANLGRKSTQSLEIQTQPDVEVAACFRIALRELEILVEQIAGAGRELP